MRSPDRGNVPYTDPLQEACRLRHASHKFGYVGHLDDGQCQNIQASLAPFNIDIDVLMVGEPFRPGEPWWLPDHATTVRMRPLRDALQEMGGYFGVASGVGRRLASHNAPSRQIKRLQGTLAAFKAALAAIESASEHGVFASYDDGDGLGERPWWERRPLPGTAGGADPVTSAHEGLTRLVARLQRRLDKLEAEGSSSSGNAGKTHNQYWKELALLWGAITANASERRPKDLQEFLLACSASLFLKAAKSRALENFVARNFPQTNS
jgi:hypothetical protein